VTTHPRPPVRYPIAERIGDLLELELGQSIDARRMLNDPLYARDVLLVCEAAPGSELDELARRFRQAPAFRMRDPVPAPASSPPSTGFSVSGPGVNTGVPTDVAALASDGTRRRPWYSPGRWLGR